MLVCIDVIVKLWFSVLSNLKSHTIIRGGGGGTNDDAYFCPLKTPEVRSRSQLHKKGTIAQNMTQSSNDLLSPTKLMVARAANGN